MYRLIDQALDKGVKVAVCSTSNEKAVCIIRFIIVIDCVISFPWLKMVKSNYCMSHGFCWHSKTIVISESKGSHWHFSLSRFYMFENYVRLYIDVRIDSSQSCYFCQVNLLVNWIILIIEPFLMLTSDLYVLGLGICNSSMIVGAWTSRKNQDICRRCGSPKKAWFNKVFILLVLI